MGAGKECCFGANGEIVMNESVDMGGNEYGGVTVLVEKLRSRSISMPLLHSDHAHPALKAHQGGQVHRQSHLPTTWIGSANRRR